MATIQEIQSYLAQNPSLTDAQIASAMNQYGVTPEQMAQATNIALPDIQQRYDTAIQQNRNQEIASRAQAILAAGGNEYDIAREASQYNISAKDLSNALNIPLERVNELSAGLLDSKIPARPTFSGVAAAWNNTHIAKYGSPLNLATAPKEAVQNQVAQLQSETAQKQAEWDRLYGNTPEGKIIKETPPPDWRQIYEPWVKTHIEKYGGIVNRPWSADEAAINQKRELDQKYIQAVEDYNKKYGTNVAPDPWAIGSLAQPSEIYKQPEKSKWYENPLNIAALIAATYFGAPYLAEAFGGAAGAAGGAAGGTGLTVGAGGVTGLTAGAGGATGLLAPAGFTLAPEVGAGLLAGGALSGASSASVPSAFETAVNTALGQTPELGTFGNVGTAGFGTALPSATELAAALETAGFAPGTAANLAGLTSAGTGATNLLGGATAFNPVSAGKSISPMDALRAANTLKNLAQPEQKKIEQQLATAGISGAVNYSDLLNLLAKKAQTTGLLGTQYQPSSINLSSLLG